MELPPRLVVSVAANPKTCEGVFEKGKEFCAVVKASTKCDHATCAVPDSSKVRIVRSCNSNSTKKSTNFVRIRILHVHTVLRTFGCGNPVRVSRNFSTINLNRRVVSNLVYDPHSKGGPRLVHRCRPRVCRAPEPERYRRPGGGVGRDV